MVFIYAYVCYGTNNKYNHPYINIKDEVGTKKYVPIAEDESFSGFEYIIGNR